MTRLVVTRITHSCHLLELGGATVLTDPWCTTKEGYDPGRAGRGGVTVARLFNADPREG